MRYCFDTSAWFRLPSSGYRGRPSPEPCGSPISLVLCGSKTARRSVTDTSGLPWCRLTATSRICSLRSEEILATSGGLVVSRQVKPHLCFRQRSGALLRSREVSVKACPGLGTPAILDRLALRRVQMLPSARLTASASQRYKFSGLNTRGLLSHCVRFVTHQSPGEWQHSLLARPLRL